MRSDKHTDIANRLPIIRIGAGHAKAKGFESRVECL
jgi:hypothetical protein